MIRISAAAAISMSVLTSTSASLAAREVHSQVAQAAGHGHQTHQQPAAGGTHAHSSAAHDTADVVLQTHPKKLEAGTSAELAFALADSSGQPVQGLLKHHGRKLHVVVVSDDMQVLGHIHPQDFDEPVKDGSAKVFFNFPRAGRYLVAVDFVTVAHGAQDTQFLVDVAGAPSDPVAQSEARPGLTSVKLEEDDRYTEPVVLQDAVQSQTYTVTLDQPDTVKAGEEANFSYRFMKNKMPVTSLRPYLEAPLHLAVVKDDLTTFLHTHGTLIAQPHGAVDHSDHGAVALEVKGNHPGIPVAFGPEVAAAITFPEPGTYYLFAQAAHGDHLVISRFAVHVR
ncbi:hypothetical protein H9Q09_21265 [Aurantimonas sp. DM33-3]|uniref:hypothetical protein n=1 Tax=Aurantimonas sp. DM33-3 TaxID=2766955 RepID=UPI001652822B|nr:hypothetical protein [Aurantimonas sp. DM33-3]MBC6718715.1 hypothetical protein [Aurantimonas sp. DM33-3]